MEKPQVTRRGGRTQRYRVFVLETVKGAKQFQRQKTIRPMKRTLSALPVVLALLVRATPSKHSATAAVPSPTGPSRLLTRMQYLVDPTRDDPFLANGAKRELLVRFWYPASLGLGCQPAEYTSPRVWSYFSQLVAISLPKVRTNSCLDASIAEGAHPVVLFSHGYTGACTDYTFVFEDLASRGYVVVSVDHTFEATAVEFPDGRFVKSVFGSYLAEKHITGRRSGLLFGLVGAVEKLEVRPA